MRGQHCDIISCFGMWSSSMIMGGGTGLADQPPDKCLLYGTWKASRCDLRGPKFQKIFKLHADNQLLGREASLMTGLDRTMEFLCKANGATLHYVFCPFLLGQTSEKFPFLHVRLLASYICFCWSLSNKKMWPLTPTNLKRPIQGKLAMNRNGKQIVTQ